MVNAALGGMRCSGFLADSDEACAKAGKGRRVKYELLHLKISRSCRVQARQAPKQFCQCTPCAANWPPDHLFRYFFKTMISGFSLAALLCTTSALTLVPVLSLRAR